jgi:hypothetical protein
VDVILYGLVLIEFRDSQQRSQSLTAEEKLMIFNTTLFS